MPAPREREVKQAPPRRPRDSRGVEELNSLFFHGSVSGEEPKGSRKREGRGLKDRRLRFPK